MGSTPRYRRGNGDYADLRTEWFEVKVRSLALINNVRQSINRSDPVLVVGRLSTHQWEAKDGTKHWAMQIQAEAVGHDLRWGDTRFTKVPMAQHRRGLAEPGGEEVAADPLTGEVLGDSTTGVSDSTSESSDLVDGADQAFDHQAGDNGAVGEAMTGLPSTSPAFEAPPDFDYQDGDQVAPVPVSV